MTTTDFNAAFAEMSLTREARKVLTDYLARLQSKTAGLKKDDQEELVRDIQEHLYNALEAKLKKTRSKKDTLDAQIVMEVLSALGEPEEYLESTQTPEGIKGSTPPRRLRRAREGRILGGVAMGIANYFRIDVVIVRVIMIGLVLTGISAVIYPILWIVIPDETEGENAVAAAAAQGDPSRPRWIRLLGRICWKLLIIFITLCFYLPVFLVLFVLTLAFFVIPLVWLFQPSNFLGFNTIAILGYLLPVVSLSLGCIFLALLLLFMNIVTRIHYKRSMLRGNSLKYLGSAALIAICIALISAVYTGANNVNRGSISESTTFPAASTLNIVIESEIIASDITVVGSDTVQDVTLTVTRKARGYSTDNAQHNAEKIDSTWAISGDTLSLNTWIGDRWVNHNAAVEYRLLVPKTTSLQLHNPIGRTIIEDISAEKMLVDNSVGSLEIRDSWAADASFKNSLGLIEISAFAPPIVLHAPLSATMPERIFDDATLPAPATSFTVSNELGAIRLEQVVTSQTAITANLGSIEIDTCSFAGEVTNDMGSIVINDHLGALTVSNSMGSINASFLRMYDNETYEFESNMGSVNLDLPPGLNPIFDTSHRMGNADQRYRPVAGGARPQIMITSDMGSVEIR